MLVKNLITGSTPCILHRNGTPPQWAARWEQAVADFFRQDLEPFEPCPELAILTWNTRPTTSLLERCLERWDTTCLTLGRNLPRWRMDMKAVLNADALERVTAEYVLAVDATDVLVVSPPRRVITEFQSYGCDILFSGERNSYPEVPHLEDFERSIAESPYCHLNAGAWMGRTEAARRFFKDCLKEHNTDLVEAHPAAHVLRDDQGLTRKTFKRYYPAAQVDYHCRVFQSLFKVTPDSEVLITLGHPSAPTAAGDSQPLAL